MKFKNFEGVEYTVNYNKLKLKFLDVFVFYKNIIFAFYLMNYFKLKKGF